MWLDIRRAAAAAAVALAGCSGGGGSGSAPPATVPQPFLAVSDVERVIAQAVGEAQARGVRAHIAVVDRVGNVLATFAMEGAPATIAIDSGLGVTGGLDGTPAGTVPAMLSAIAKATTGAYLSSQGNAFSTRTAGQIVQEHFNPNEAHQPSGPLYGVQFSQLSCSDVNRNLAHGSVGPKRSPLGLSADPGGLPIYKNGVLVGGLGIEANGRYGLDRDITDLDQDDEEIIAVAGTDGLAAPADIRGDRITADGRTFRFVDSENVRSNPRQPPAFATLPGALIAVPGYSTAAIQGGTVFGSAASGIRADAATFAASGGWILVNDADANRYAPRDTATMRAADAQVILVEAIGVAQRARAQIRRPLGSFAQVTIAVVDRDGEIVGLVRTADAPVFGIDVSVQKARTALFFSHPLASAELSRAPSARYLTFPVRPFRDIALFATDLEAFTHGAALTGGFAWSARAVGNLHRPYFPDGLENSPRGPLSTPIEQWSPFNVGFQLDLVYNQLVKGVLGDVSEGCAGRARAGESEAPGDTGLPLLRNGAQVFPGGVPIYRGDTLVGAVGVSGDGVDQDDMIAYLGLENAARRLANGIGNAPRERRVDTLTPLGVRLRYVQCPQSPFNGSSEQNVCG